MQASSSTTRMCGWGDFDVMGSGSLSATAAAISPAGSIPTARGGTKGALISFQFQRSRSGQKCTWEDVIRRALLHSVDSDRLVRWDQVVFMSFPRILLVDDNIAVRTTLAQVLEMSQFEVITAASVNEALALIGKETFDVLLTDLHMPGAGDGMTV